MCFIIGNKADFQLSVPAKFTISYTDAEKKKTDYIFENANQEIHC